ncbi:MAG: peptidylprolyl isomerase, partial [Elusimicrobia bacterium]|nr:peptidylprolyl isomerase [Elusimicrobiota bacterium]
MGRGRETGPDLARLDRENGPAAQRTAVAPVPSPRAATRKAEPAAPPRDPAAVMVPEGATETAPDVFKARFATTKGDFVVQVNREWAPHGADRFYNLVKIGFFDGCEFFRVIDGFMAQVGIHGDPRVAARWRAAPIPDDPPVGHHNARGAVTFATAGPNTRTTQFFLNFKDNSFLDNMGFPPIGTVVEGEEVLDKHYRGHGEGAPRGNGPD